MSEPRWIVIPNFSGLQHTDALRSESGMPWFKMFTRTLADDAVMDLTTHRRWIYVGLLMHYSRSRGLVAVSTAKLSRYLSCRVTMSDLESLNEAGLIKFSASKPAGIDAGNIAGTTREEKRREEQQQALAPTEATPPKPNRPRDELWDALVEELEEPATRSERGKRNDAVKQLRDVGATPDEIRLRSARYRQRWPQITFTDQALAKHWTELGKDEPPNGQPPKRRYGRGVTAEEVLERAGIDMKELTP